MPADDSGESGESGESIRGDRRQIRHQYEWELFQLLEQVPAGVFVVTARGKPYYANAQARALLGLAAVPDHVDRFSEVYQAFEIGTDRPYPTERLPLVRALAGEHCEISDIEVRGRGDAIPLHISGSPVKIGGQTAFAIIALQDMRELRRIATQDALTGLPNRIAVAEAFARERLRAERGRYAISVALLDFDRFKAVNDTFGHPTGDSVLRLGASAIVGALRRTDIVARWGGEELMVLLPHTNLDQARLAVEKALAAVRALEVPVATTAHRAVEAPARAPTVRITFSAGVVEADSNESLDEIVCRADIALYEAKHAGRDRVVTRP